MQLAYVQVFCAFVVGGLEHTDFEHKWASSPGRKCSSATKNSGSVRVRSQEEAERLELGKP